jgi:hypothetical protein
VGIRKEEAVRLAYRGECVSPGDLRRRVVVDGDVVAGAGAGDVADADPADPRLLRVMVAADEVPLLEEEERSLCDRSLVLRLPPVKTKANAKVKKNLLPRHAPLLLP